MPAKRGYAQMAQAAWLNAARLRGYLVVAAVVQAAALLFLLATAQGMLDRNGNLIGTDFLAFKTAGNLIAAGLSPYDTGTLIAAQRTIFASPTGYTAFFYPPPFLLFCRPLAELGYLPALAVWLAVTGAAYALAVRAWLGRLPAVALLAFPPVLLTITHGQTAFLVSALLGGGLWLVARGKPGWGGVLIGLAIIKPQFGVLVPIALIAAREWRAIVAAGLSASVLAGAATAVFGLDLWAEWWAVSRPAQDAMASGVIGFAKMQSLFSAARLAGLSTSVAYALQAVLGAGVAVVLAWRAWQRGLTPEVAALTLCGALLATPFVLDYDLALLAFPLVLLARGEVGRRDREIGVAAFIVAAFARPLASATGVAIAPWVLIGLFAVLAGRAGRAAAQA